MECYGSCLQIFQRPYLNGNRRWSFCVYVGRDEVLESSGEEVQETVLCSCSAGVPGRFSSSLSQFQSEVEQEYFGARKVQGSEKKEALRKLGNGSIAWVLAIPHLILTVDKGGASVDMCEGKVKT